MELFNIETNIENLKVNAIFKSTSLLKNNSGKFQSTNSFLHQHAYHEIHYIKSGKVMFEFENTTKTFSDNSLIIIAPGTIHMVKFISENVEHSAFELSLLQTKNGKDVFSQYSSMFKNIKGYDHFKTNEKNMFLELKNNLTSHTDIKNEYICVATLTLVFFEITDLIHQKYNRKNQKTQKTVQKKKATDVQIIGFIEDYYSQPLTIANLASELHVTPRHAERIVKKIFRKTFTALLQEYRISVAKYKMRNEPNSSLEKIGTSVGFETYSIFWKNFKKFTGVAPSEYRKDIQNKTLF